MKKLLTCLLTACNGDVLWCVCRRQQLADADAETRAMATNINLDGEPQQQRWESVPQAGAGCSAFASRQLVRSLSQLSCHVIAAQPEAWSGPN